MTITDTVRLEMQEHHEKHGSWRAVGRIIGKSPAYAQRVVRGDLEPSQEVIARWMASRSCVPVKHEQIAYPIDHDAIVHLLPAGNGTLHTYTVPDNAEVVIVPAGARIVKPKPAQPKRKRTRIDITGLPLSVQEAREVLLWWLFRDKRDDWPDWLTRPQAEDAGTDPGDVASDGLARSD